MAELPSVGFEDMPDEIILQIFKHLGLYDNDASSQVCKRWKLLSEDQSLWQKINLNCRKVPAKFIEKALRHGCQYLNLETQIENVPGPDSFSVKNQLKYLIISFGISVNFGTNLSNQGVGTEQQVVMENLLGATQFLEKLSIIYRWKPSYYFQPNLIQNKQLTVLRIVGHKSLTFETVKSIFTNCLELTEVNLEGCCMPVEALSFLCNNLTKKIEKLSLFVIHAFDSYDEILEEEHVIALANRCPQLEELDMRGQKNYISEVALSTIIEKLQNLVKLSLRNDAEQIRFPKLLELRSMPNLKHFNVFGSKSFMEALVKNLPNLKINEGRFDIAHPDPRYLGYLWEMQCKPTQDFY